MLPRVSTHELGTSRRDVMLVDFLFGDSISAPPTTKLFDQNGSSHKGTWFSGLVAGTSPIVCAEDV